jgi:hypothetical protein
VLKDGGRGKYAKRLGHGSTKVRLAPEVTGAFAIEKAVPETSRLLLQTATRAAQHTA